MQPLIFWTFLSRMKSSFDFPVEKKNQVMTKIEDIQKLLFRSSAVDFETKLKAAQEYNESKEIFHPGKERFLLEWLVQNLLKSPNPTNNDVEMDQTIPK